MNIKIACHLGFLSLFCLILTGCFGSDTKPAMPICELLDENDEWVGPAVKLKERYGTPLSLALVLLEPPLSDLDKKHVRPRASDWDEYRIRSERWDASPYNPDDALDFIGWYTQLSTQRNNLNWQGAGDHYLALRLGHGDFHRFDAEKYPELTKQAEHIQVRAERWERELQGCPSHWTSESWLNKLKVW